MAPLSPTPLKEAMRSNFITSMFVLELPFNHVCIYNMTQVANNISVYTVLIELVPTKLVIKALFHIQAA